MNTPTPQQRVILSPQTQHLPSWVHNAPRQILPLGWWLLLAQKLYAARCTRAFVPHTERPYVVKPMSLGASLPPLITSKCLWPQNPRHNTAHQHVHTSSHLLTEESAVPKAARPTAQAEKLGGVCRPEPLFSWGVLVLRAFLIWKIDI